ncbi:MAG: terminase TerL endonuclease subunit [Bacteroidota bacterium]
MSVPLYQQYIDRVSSGERISSKYERLAVKRSVQHMKDDRYFFDMEAVNRVLEVFSLFRHTKGKYAGKPFDLMDWQAFVLAMIFGIKVKSTGLRLYRKLLLCVPKKNGKSEFAGALGVFMTYFDHEFGAEVYSAANKYDQALFSWNAGKVIIKTMSREYESMNAILKVMDSITNRQLINTEDGSFFKPLASDAKTIDGVNPHCGIVDEYHEAKSTAIPDNLESGMVAREQPLLCIITTRGFNIKGPLWKLEQSYKQILEGVAENDEVLPMMYGPDEGDDWHDPKTWEKANPGLGRTPTIEGLQSEYQKAVTEGRSREINFRTKNLNEWTTVGKRWLKDSHVMSGSSSIDHNQLVGRRCYAGLDLAKTRDITAVALLFPPDESCKQFRTIMYYYCPEENADERSKQDKVPYVEWGKKEWLTLTPGNVTDYEFIRTDLLELGTKYDIAGISYDPWNASHLASQLYEEGIDVNEFRQTASKFNEPIRFMEATILKGLLNHGDDQILRWMFGNVQLLIDSNGNCKIDKRKSREKVDGVVALAMAFGEYLDQKETPLPKFNVVWR